MGRAIRLGLERCRICSSATEDASRICAACQGAIDRGDREALTERGLTYMVGRFPIIARDEERLRQTIAKAHGRLFAQQ